MREHLGRIIVVSLLVLVVGVPFLLRAVIGETQPIYADPELKLIVVTPHNEQIREEFARAFNAWRGEQGLDPVQFDWRTMGGTSDNRKLVQSLLQSRIDVGREDDGIEMDLFFGGGDFELNILARGLPAERDGQTVYISALEAPDLPDGLLEAAFPEPTLGGSPLYHPDRLWVGVVVASFGIVYNRDLLRMHDLPEPVTWRDMASPAYRGWVALADPGHSGSIAATYNVIIQRAGWDEGWQMLRRVFANARYFTAGASKVPVDVSAGEAMAGMCIDFYGRFQAGAVGGDRVGYVDPPGMTATTADPIAILRGAPHRELANQFVVWLLSPEAQQLWQRKLGTAGGPVQYELRRQPIRRDVYTEANRADWTDPQVDPFATASPLLPGVPDYYFLVAPISHAMAIDVHDDLVAAWQALHRTSTDHPNHARMVALFEAMPEELTVPWPDEGLRIYWQAALASPAHPRHAEVRQTLATFRKSLSDRYAGSANSDALLEARLQWTRFFRDNYRAVVRLSEE